jgi:hypothetical protein
VGAGRKGIMDLGQVTRRRDLAGKVGVAFCAIALLAFGTVYYLSGKREALLAETGQAEIYRVTRGDGGCEIRFALGTAHGMTPGARVVIFNEAGQQVGTGTVEVSSRTDAVAQVTTDQEIKVGYLVSCA